MNSTKHCKKCNSLKELFEFSRHSSTKDKHSNVCKECDKARSKQWYQNNKEKKAEVCRNYYVKEKEAVLKRSKTYYNKNKEIVASRVKEYVLKNKSKATAKSAKYRASRLNRTPNWLTEQDLKLIDAKYAIAKWLSAIVGIEYEVDHIVPLQGKYVSGLHAPNNLAIIHRVKNREKGNRYST